MAPPKVAKQYLSFWFWIDLVASVPYTLLEAVLLADSGEDVETLSKTEGKRHYDATTLQHYDATTLRRYDATTL